LGDGLQNFVVRHFQELLGRILPSKWNEKGPSGKKTRRVPGASAKIRKFASNHTSSGNSFSFFVVFSLL